MGIDRQEPHSSIAFKVEDLKQWVDPDEETNLNNFTFSSEKPNDYSCEKRMPESYESAIKRIPVDSSKKNLLRGSRSATKLNVEDLKDLSRRYFQKKGKFNFSCFLLVKTFLIIVLEDTSCSEIDLNKVSFDWEVR